MLRIRKRLVLTVMVFLLALVLGYSGYVLYNYLIQNAIEQIQKGVAQGLRRKARDMINPFKWIKK